MKKLLLAVIGLLALATQTTAAELTVSAAASLANAFDELEGSVKSFSHFL